ncbi:MAG: NAD(P)-dependent oxidoreductase [Rhodospirillaceae bacterium]|nr:NAD(P)-dependent oxidoreductase [Rhodospirillaceae bacterium]
MSNTGPVLVTGAGGAIGAWVIAALMGRGIDCVAFDLSDDRRRLRLIMDEARVAGVRWVTGNIAESAAVEATVAAHKPSAIIHLAALQVPFVKADPVLGAQVNVVGTANVFEAARRHGVRRLVYASSVAAFTDPRTGFPNTLYGVYKLADEGIGRIYADDWDVPNIGIRPHTVYGPTRDQGMTSAPTKAILAAVAGRSYEIPFTGPVSFQYVGEVAEIFVRCAQAEIAAKDSRVFDIATPPVTVEAIIDEIKRQVPDARITAKGQPIPLPSRFDATALKALVGAWPETSLAEGVRRTMDAFKDLLARGLVSPEAA